MGETEISWTHRPGTVGRTWNPGQGCSRVSEGCRNCYAERLAARFAESGWSKGLINLKTRKWNGTVRLAPHKLAEPLSWRKPSTVFVNSMTDLFHEGYSNNDIAAVFGVMAACPQHTFQILTKRATRMREWFEWLAIQPSDAGPAWHQSATYCARRAFDMLEWDERLNRADDHKAWPLRNVWLGVSVENQEAMDRWVELWQTPAVVRFLSVEPMIGPVELRCADCNGTPNDHCGPDRGGCPRAFPDWVIAGCESGPGARSCDVQWLRSLRKQCAAVGLAYFLKQGREESERCEECGELVRSYAHSPTLADYSCGCTVEGAEAGDPLPISTGEGSKRKAGGVVELPYLDGVQHSAFPEVRHG